MKCSAAVSVLALAVAAVAIPMEQGNAQFKRGLEHPGYGDEMHSKSKRNDGGNYDTSYSPQYKRDDDGEGYESGFGKQYKRNQYGSPFSREGVNDNLNGNSRDNIGNSRDNVGNRGDNCSAHSRKQVCCDGGLGCLVQVLGDRCGTNAYCCDTSSGPGTAVDLKLLSCLKL
ncbi:hypothetical protein CDD80_2167 [Ophiocordyceps camponoti-rufipedis]|uniref:Hydrophobin n=1 Tax=Ophiocordyceps camponoti-rufipedis TaxID=2004952 RepID=A0A2C5Z7E5_9HYPO|nr:hypothetical protein CDD80_2167 [Ophiocordyceps camponoti-rufipedis]